MKTRVKVKTLHTKLEFCGKQNSVFINIEVDYRLMFHLGQKVCKPMFKSNKNTDFKFSGK